MSVTEEVFLNSFYRSISGEYQDQKNLMWGVSDMQDQTYLWFAALYRDWYSQRQFLSTSAATKDANNSIGYRDWDTLNAGMKFICWATCNRK